MGYHRTPRTVTTREQLTELVEAYSEFDEFAFDTETRPPNYPRGFEDWAIKDQNAYVKTVSLDPRRNEVFWISMAGPGRVDAIPFGHPIGEISVPAHQEIYYVPDEDRVGEVVKQGPRKGQPYMKRRQRKVPDQYHEAPTQLRPSEVFAALEPLFFSKRTKVGHNIKFDLRSITKYYDGRIPPPPYADTYVAAVLLDENRVSNSLDNLAKTFWGVAYPQLGKSGVQNHPFSQAALYALKDAKYTWLLWDRFKDQIAAEKLRGVFRLEMDILRVLIEMENDGVLIDRAAMEQLGQHLHEVLIKLQGTLYEANGEPFNINSPEQLTDFLYDIRGHKVTKTTPTGRPSTDKYALEDLAKKDPAVQALVDYRRVEKTLGTYVDGLLPLLVNDKLSASFKQVGTKTGRFSCVSGSTLLHTSRGTFRFAEYLPQEGDLVLTHERRWMPVLRKIYKGKQPMYKVTASDGSYVECTGDHRLLTPSGWRYVRDIAVGEEVVSSERLEEVHLGCVEPTEGAEVVPVRRQAHGATGGRGVGHYVPQRAAHRDDAARPGAVEVREGVAVLALEGGDEEPHDWQEWLAAPRAQGRHRLRRRLPHAESQWSLREGTSSGHGRGAGSVVASCRVAGASHQRGQDGQPAGQPSSGDARRAPSAARQVVTIREKAPLGAMGVWDIEVAGDHSYAAQGFFHHNCSDPNLQNIPRSGDVEGDEYGFGKLIRSMFMAPDGHYLVGADYDQIELRVYAYFTQDPLMLETFKKGLDPHAATTANILGKPIDQVTKEERQLGKTINFASIYQATAPTIARQANIREKEAEKFLKEYHKTYDVAFRWNRATVKQALRGKPVPYVRTILGRKRRLPDLMSVNKWDRLKAERQAVNTVIQGSAADIIKVAMVHLHRAFDGTPFRLILSVHDELISVAPEGRQEECAEIMSDVMQGVKLLGDVPLTAEAKWGRSWSEAK